MKKVYIRHFLYIFALLILAAFAAGCSKSKPQSTVTPVAAPAITSVNINTGPYNTEVEITGTGFSTTPSQNKLFFNGQAAVVESPTPTTIYTLVPLGAGTGNITISVNGSATVVGPVFNYQVQEVVIPFTAANDTIAINGPVSIASFYQPYGLAIDASQNIYVAEQANNLVRKITPGGIVSTLAGSGAKGFSDGTGTSASFNNPTGVAVDAAGNVYVADGGNNLIRKITPAGVVSTIAGSTTKGYADGVGAAARFNRPTDLVVDNSGNLYVTDLYNYRIRKITPDGVVSTFAGSGSYFSADGIGTGANFDNPNDIAIDKNNNLYVSQGDNLIRKITPDGTVTSIAGTVASTLTSTFTAPQGLFVDNSGNLYIENSGHYQFDKLSPNGQLSVFAGSGNQQYTNGPVATAGLSFMEGIVIDNNGNIYFSEGNDIRKITMQ